MDPKISREQHSDEDRSQSAADYLRRSRTEMDYQAESGNVESSIVPTRQYDQNPELARKPDPFTQNITPNHEQSSERQPSRMRSLVAEEGFKTSEIAGRGQNSGHKDANIIPDQEVVSSLRVLRRINSWILIGELI